MSENPFKPSFGKTPPLLAGRDPLVSQFGEMFRSGEWTPARMSILQGLRGIGKTVLLNAIEDAAHENGWLVLSETAHTGLVERLTATALPRLLREHDPQSQRRDVTAGGIAAVGSLTTQISERHLPSQDLRDQLTLLCELAADLGIGVLLTLDELHAHALPEITPITVALQHLQREDRDIAFVGAGLPDNINGVLQDKGTTFLRRATRIDLDSLTIDESRAALHDPIVVAGRSIDSDALEYAALASRGYPFLVQAIGSAAWSATPRTDSITMADVEQASRRAHRTMGQHVHAPSMKSLSATDRTYLAAMANDAGPSRTNAIAKRMGVSIGYASVYRQRLLDAGLIEAPERGVVRFALPYLRDYLREHSVANTLNPTARSTFPEHEPDLDAGLR
ncbi:AAA family ATPase [Agrococcus sp. KRD186]|uniref:AAA family ATPase n=1 Tax=Agrococcus sp. KRD186 TaxID=2729730 RepID=UPI0019D1A365